MHITILHITNIIDTMKEIELNIDNKEMEEKYE